MSDGVDKPHLANLLELVSLLDCTMVRLQSLAAQIAVPAPIFTRKVRACGACWINALAHA